MSDMTTEERLAAVLERLADASRHSDTVLSELQTLNATLLRIAVALEKIAADPGIIDELRQQLKANTDALQQAIDHNQPPK